MKSQEKKYNLFLIIYFPNIVSKGWGMKCWENDGKKWREKGLKTQLCNDDVFVCLLKVVKKFEFEFDLKVRKVEEFKMGI